MTSFRSLLLAGVITFAVSAPAWAADIAPTAVEPAAPAVSFSWTGFYAGVQGGYAWGKSTFFAPSDNFRVPLSPKGGFGGLYAGYNYQSPSNILIGVEADINAGSVSGSGNYRVSNFNIQRYDAKTDVFGSARIRVGYALDKFLPFVTGGLAVADYKNEASGPLAGSASWSDTYTGWTAGGGVEYAFTDNVVARVEYHYSDYGSQSFARTPGINDRFWRAHSVDLKTNDVRVGIGYKF